jgi:CCR4-NOT transcription complex subunit 6
LTVFIGPPSPADREEIIYDESAAPRDKFTVASYNILCDMSATQTQYGYTPSAALNWEHRKDLILAEIRQRNADIVCLQEVDQENYNDFFRAELAHDDYRGVYWPRSRAKTMGEREAKFVDGCATFYKNSKYVTSNSVLVRGSTVVLTFVTGTFYLTSKSSTFATSPSIDLT